MNRDQGTIPKVSVVVHNYKGTYNLEKCLGSLLTTDYEAFELIVVDYGTKGIEGWISEKFPGVKVLRFNEDMGPAAHRSAALEMTDERSKYIAFIDNDVDVCGKWLRELVNVMESDPMVGLVQPKLLKKESPSEVDSLGGYMDVVGFIYKPWSGKDLRLLSPTEITYAEGAALLLRREVLKKIGLPFDPDFYYSDDVDLGLRLWLAGYRVLLVPTAVAVHQRGINRYIGKHPAKVQYLHSRNKVMTLVKIYSVQNLFKFLPVLILLLIVQAVVLLRFRPDHGIATLRGILWNVVNLRKIWRKRLMVQRLVRKVPDRDLFKRLMPPSLTRLYRALLFHYGERS